MANTWQATLLALNPDHYWPLDEASGDFIDGGDTGGFDLAINGPAGTVDEIWRQAPGLCVRGTPRSFGLVKTGAGRPYGAFQGGVALGGARHRGAGLLVHGVRPSHRCHPNVFQHHMGQQWGASLQV